jgi:hypothetical protein
MSGLYNININIATQRITACAIVYTNNGISVNNANKQNKKKNEKETSRRDFHIHYVEAKISKCNMLISTKFV